MIARRKQRLGKSGEGGYVLLLVVFMATALLVVAMMVAPNILTEGKREKEKEMIWRGRQYARGVKLYYRKMGRFPTSIDDLTKPKIGSLRFMRQSYKDPMNKEDGSWRLIYVGPAGQLIGSLKPPQANLQFGQAGGMGTLGALASPAAQGQPGAFGQSNTFGQSNAFGQPGAFGQMGQPGTPSGGATAGINLANPANPASPAIPGNAANPSGVTGAPVSADQSTDPNAQPIPTGDTPTIVGGNIIGVGSKINQRSVIVYDKAKNYRLFEFIWDPSKDSFGIGQPGVQTGTGQTSGLIPLTSGGQNPINPQQPGQNPLNPPQNPQQQPQNPPQQP
jgi:hypothetical protein